MEIYWTLKAQDGLERIYRYALSYNRQHANDVLDRLITGSAALTTHPAFVFFYSEQHRYALNTREVIFHQYTRNTIEKCPHPPLPFFISA